MADPYQTLGVAKGASAADIKKAYRKLAKELHPDRNKTNPKASERFSQVTGAYDLLSDADKRARFDRGEIDGDGNPASPFAGGGGGFGGGRPGAGPGGFAGFTGGAPFGGGGGEADMSDILDGLFGGARGGAGGFPGGGFGGRRAPPAKGANVAYRLQVPFTDAATGAAQRITLADGKTIDLKLPAGLEGGTQMRIAGKGEMGTGGPGDAIVTLDVEPHRFFTRDGDNIRLDLPITLREAVLGGAVRVPTVEKPVMLTVPKGASSGQTLRIKGRGFTAKSGTRGDQLVTLLVTLPPSDAALTAFVESWDGAEGNPRTALGV